MATKNGGYGYPNPYNETSPGEEPDNKDLFVSYDQMMSDHLSTGPMDETPNSKSGGGIMGGPAPGEPNPAKTGD
jgi:hypothetical protein